MANLLSQNIGTNYKSILNLDATTINTPLDATLRAVTDGMGTSSPLQLSTDQVGLSRTVNLSAGATNPRLFNEVYTINNSGAQTGTLTGIFLNATETALNGITHNLMDLQMNSSSRFVVSRLGIATAEGLISTGNIINSSGGSYQWISRSRMNAPSDGVITLLNNGSTDFTRLQLGGTTSSFPAIKRNGTAIDFRLADDSAACDITANIIRAAGKIDVYGDGPSGVIGMVTLTNTLNLRKFVKIVGEGGIGANDASAAFQIDGTTRGFLPPRMTTAQVNAIATPAEGLVVFNTTISHLCVYQAGVWVRLNHSPM
jgi:hypothetical protein